MIFSVRFARENLANFYKMKKILFSTSFIEGAPPVYFFYSFLLISIQAMHVYWFYFILKLLCRIALGHKISDNREYSDNKKEN